MADIYLVRFDKQDAMLKDISARLDALETGHAPIPAPVPPVFDYVDGDISEPTDEEFKAGVDLPKAESPSDYPAIVKLARVCRLPNGDLTRGLESMRETYKEIAALRSSAKTYFADNCKPRPSWVAQQILCLTGNGFASPWRWETPIDMAGIRIQTFNGYGIEQVALTSGCFVNGGLVLDMIGG